MAFRKLEPPAHSIVYNVQTCDHCGRDLESYNDGHRYDYYPSIEITMRGGAYEDDSHYDGNVCSINCARAWLDEQANHSPGWVEPQ